jgi:agmatinase
VRDRGGLIYTARDLRGLEGPAQLAPVLDAIRTRLASGRSPAVYLSLDIDCLDPGLRAGHRHAEPGGLTTAQVLSVLEELADLRFVGMDCRRGRAALRPRRMTSYAAPASSGPTSAAAIAARRARRAR